MSFFSRLVLALACLALAAPASSVETTAAMPAEPACVFCALPKPELVFQTPDYSIKPSQGAMGIEGYVLLIPREHVASFSDLSETAHAAFRQEAARTVATVAAAYGPPVVFEHGVTGQSIKHAHLHVLPGIAFDELVAQTERLLGPGIAKKEIDPEDAWRETAAAKATAGGYLYLENPSSKKAVVFSAGPAPERAMILRKAAAAAVGRPELADWKAVRQDPVMAEADKRMVERTLERLSPERLGALVRSVLTPELRNGVWKKIMIDGPAGHCYVASEALYHLLGGKAAGWVPMVGPGVAMHGLPAGTHWFLRRDPFHWLYDVTAAQFPDGYPNYDRAHGSGFLTGSPSKNAAEVIRRAKALLAAR